MIAVARNMGVPVVGNRPSPAIRGARSTQGCAVAQPAIPREASKAGITYIDVDGLLDERGVLTRPQLRRPDGAARRRSRRRSLHPRRRARAH